MSDLVITQDDATTSPPAGTASIYPKTDGAFYTKTPAGVETALKGATGDTGATGATGPGVATGGTDNQVLTKTSATNYETDWSTIAGTANQVTVTHTANTLTLAAPQDLHTAANPTFGTVTAALSGAATSAGKSTNLVGGNGTTLLGSIPYQSGTDTTTQLAPNTTTTKKFLRETGDGTNGTAPAWDTIQAADVPTLNQNTSGTAANVTGTVAIGNGGTGQTTKAPAFDALSPMTTGGDLIYGGASGTGTRLANGTAGQVLTSAGTTVAPTWAAAATANGATQIENVGLAASVDGTNLTIALKQADGSTDPSAGAGAVKVAMRHPTATIGGYNLRSITSALSLVITSGSTLGLTPAMNQYIWVFLVDSDGSGSMKLAVSSDVIKDGTLATTVAEGGAGGAATFGTLYSDAIYSAKPVRLIGRIKINETLFTDGWDQTPLEVTVNPQPIPTNTDWQSYPGSPAFTNVTLGTGGTASFKYRRIGDSLEIMAGFSLGTSGDVTDTLVIPIPTGYTIDYTKLTQNIQGVGIAYSVDGGSNRPSGTVVTANGANSLWVTGAELGAAGLIWNASVPFNWAATYGFNIRAAIPITGWSRYGAE